MTSIVLKEGFSIDDFPGAKDVYLHKGDLLLYEGDQHRESAFFIVSGEMNVRIISGSGHETSLYDLMPGELVGELALFGFKARTATVLATQDTHLKEIKASFLVEKIKDYDFLQRITTLFMRRYLRTHDVVCRLGQPNIGSKICRYLKSLTEQHAANVTEVVVHLPSHAELGKLLSCQRETITREMKKLVSANIIESKPGSCFKVNVRNVDLYLADMLE